MEGHFWNRFFLQVWVCSTISRLVIKEGLQESVTLGTWVDSMLDQPLGGVEDLCKVARKLLVWNYKAWQWSFQTDHVDTSCALNSRVPNPRPRPISCHKKNYKAHNPSLFCCPLETKAPLCCPWETKAPLEPQLPWGLSRYCASISYLPRNLFLQQKYLGYRSETFQLWNLCFLNAFSFGGWNWCDAWLGPRILF